MPSCVQVLELQIPYNWKCIDKEQSPNKKIRVQRLTINVSSDYQLNYILQRVQPWLSLVIECTLNYSKFSIEAFSANAFEGIMNITFSNENINERFLESIRPICVPHKYVIGLTLDIDQFEFQKWYFQQYVSQYPSEEKQLELYGEVIKQVQCSSLVNLKYMLQMPSSRVFFEELYYNGFQDFSLEQITNALPQNFRNNKTKVLGLTFSQNSERLRELLNYCLMVYVKLQKLSLTFNLKDIEEGEHEESEESIDNIRIDLTRNIPTLSLQKFKAEFSGNEKDLQQFIPMFQEIIKKSPRLNTLDISCISLTKDENFAYNRLLTSVRFPNKIKKLALRLDNFVIAEQFSILKSFKNVQSLVLKIENFDTKQASKTKRALTFLDKVRKLYIMADNVLWGSMELMASEVLAKFAPDLEYFSISNTEPSYQLLDEIGRGRRFIKKPLHIKIYSRYSYQKVTFAEYVKLTEDYPKINFDINIEMPK
ncbi:hypothetical protein FGO68_gene13158 [Halteria grandinella]|uniref:Uncharacterized protein n=1 Tax=Halteria grandinella TaxID=5974 RepID=A0A8J8NWB4_HALGN|nr:hypothetical protein FGO68_gene13158 [Halteria grandinella]